MTQSLVGKILEAANVIAKKAREPSANYIITNSNFLNNFLKEEKNKLRIYRIKKIFDLDG